MKFIISLTIGLSLGFLSRAQEVKVEAKDSLILKTSKARNPLKASLYSALVPGLGQAYNKKYWKIPLAVGAVGGGIMVIAYYDKSYKRFRSAFLSEINGQDHEYTDLIANITNKEEWLARKQDDRRRDRDYAIAITALLYVINIIDATVDAHLSEIRADKDLSFEPVMIQDFDQNHAMGLAIRLKF